MVRDSERVLDEYLVILAQSGSREALDQLARRWTPRLLRYAARFLGSGDLALDVVQETWSGALGNLRRLEDPARFPAWIYAIATRKCTDAVRSAVRQRRVRQEAGEDRSQEAPRADEAERAGARLDLSAALRRLPAEQRIVVHLFYLDDLSVEEIAAAVGIPAGTVKSRLHHARQALQKILEGAPSS